MKILHTADWHLGQMFHNFDRTFEHECFFAWLLEQLSGIDALIVAGDVFDSANPPIEAQKLYYKFLYQATHSFPDLNIVIVAGNHDSPGRLEAPQELLRMMRVHVVGNSTRVVPITKRDGARVGWCVAVPFLRDMAGEEAVAALYAQAWEDIARQQGSDLPIVAMGHAHFAGGLVSDTERKILIGGLESLSPKIFCSQFSYVALGHLHRAQALESHIRYSGSPIPLSFAETDYNHGVVVAELKAESPAEISIVAVPRAVHLMRVGPAGVEEVLQTLQNLQPIGSHPYVEVRVQISEPRPDLRALIEKELINKPVRLAKLEVIYPESPDDPLENLTHAGAITPQEVFTRMYHERFQEEVPADIFRAFTDLFASVQLEEAL